MSMIPKILKNFNLFVDGRGYAGLVDELTLPKLTLRTEEHRAGGMDVPVELDVGMEKLECNFTLCEYDPDVLVMFGLYTGAPVPVTLRGGFDGETNVATPVIVTLQGLWRELDFGNWKAGEKAKLKVMMALRYYKLEVDGQELVEIDAVNMIRRIDGADQLDSLRSAIGV